MHDNLRDERLSGALAHDRQLSEEEKANLKVVDLLVDLFNAGDIEGFVRRTYHPDYRMLVLDGTEWNGRRADGFNIFQGYEPFIAMETFIRDAKPTRRFQLNRAIAAGNVVVVQMSLIDAQDADYELPWCSVYTFQDGMIISDHAYLNHHDWPGSDAGLEAVGDGYDEHRPTAA